MANTIQWLLENRVIYNHLYDDITVTQIDWGVNLMLDWMDSADIEKLHIIFDTTGQSGFPTRVGDLRNAVAPLFEQDKLGVMILVTNSRLAKFLGSMITQLTRTKMEFVATRDEAIRRLQKLDQSLSELPLDLPQTQIYRYTGE